MSMSMSILPALRSIGLACALALVAGAGACVPYEFGIGYTGGYSGTFSDYGYYAWSTPPAYGFGYPYYESYWPYRYYRAAPYGYLRSYPYAYSPPLRGYGYRPAPAYRPPVHFHGNRGLHGGGIRVVPPPPAYYRR